MKLKRIFQAVVAAGLVSAIPLSIPAGERRAKVSIREVLSIGTLDDESIFQWTGVAADGEGFIYLLDAMDYSLKKFDALGRLIKKTGRRGQGPGEFMTPRLLDGSPDFLYATDQGVPGLAVFDRRLRFVKRIPFSMPISDLFVYSDDRIAAAVMGFQGPGKIVVLNAEGKVQAELAYQEKDEGMMMDSVCVALDGRGDIYIAYVFQDRIERWTAAGLRLWSKSLHGLKTIKKERLAGFFLPTETRFKDISLDRSGSIFVLGGKVAKNPSRDVYILNPSGELISTLTLPDTTHCIYIDRRDFLYVRANDGITLKKYRLAHE